MATQVQWRGGSTAEHATFTGAAREVTVDTQKQTLVLHDGSTAGGRPLLREDGSNAALSLGSAGTPSLKFTGDTNTGIYSPGADQVAVATNGTGRLFVDSSGQVGVGLTPSVFSVGKAIEIGHAGNALFGATSSQLNLMQNASYNADFKYVNTAAASYYQQLSGAHIWHTAVSGTAGNTISFSERMRITSAGLVGIGTSSPGALLDLTATAGAGGQTSVIRFGLGAAAESYIGVANAAGNIIANSAQGDTVIRNDGGKILFSTDSGTTAHAVIDSSGRLGIGSTPNRTLHVFGETALSNSANTGTFLMIPGAGGNYIYSRAADGAATAVPFVLAVGSQEALRVDTSGRLLVGTSSYSGSAKLVVQGDSASPTNGGHMSFRRDVTPGAAGSTIGFTDYSNTAGSTGAYLFAESDGAWTNGSSHPTRLVFSTTADGASSPTERMRITSGIDLVGISSPDGSHSVIVYNGTSAGTGLALFIGKYGSSAPYTGGTNSIIIWTNGNVVNTNNSYGALSDIKLKENVVDANSQWDDLKALQVRNYNFKEGQTHTQIGLVAQEVELVSPGLVSESPDRDEDGNDLGTVTKSVNYSVLYMKAVKALQEAMERIEQLEAKVAALETK